MGKLFVLGGFGKNHFYFNPKTEHWYEIAEMSGTARKQSCAVFEGRIFVTGGYTKNFPAVFQPTKTTQAFDFFANEWSPMPDMLEARYNHASVSIRNKLFVINDSSDNDFCEMYDSFSGKFVFIKPVSQFNNRWGVFPMIPLVTMGNKLIVFTLNYENYDELPLKPVEYDIEADRWTVKKEVKLPDVLQSLLMVVKVPKL